MKLLRVLSLSFILLPGTSSLFGQKVSAEFENQVSIWLGQGFGDPASSQAGARYIPALSPRLDLKNGATVDAEFSLKAYGNLSFSDFRYDTASRSINTYRAWLRYASSNFEIRAGLQKINFGSASIFRPLMWFDRMDYRDPLQLTDGVWGLLARYYFNNNSNIWLWTLYGNDKIKGWEKAPSVKDVPEFGGRLQLPVPKGEIGFSYNHRKADFSALTGQLPFSGDTEFQEDMIAFDAKWDIGPGIALEYSGRINGKDNPFAGRWEHYISAGIDYTIPAGNGLYLLAEYFNYSGTLPGGQGSIKSNYTALSFSYPVFLTHNLTGAVYYEWDKKQWSRFMNLQLKYNYISFNIMAFWNPDNTGLYRSAGENQFFAGKGVQLMLVLDF